MKTKSALKAVSAALAALCIISPAVAAKEPHTGAVRADGADLSVAMTGAPPGAITTMPATDVLAVEGEASATLNALVNPGGTPTIVGLEWGMVPMWWHQTPAVPVGSGLTPVAVSQTLTGLTAGVLYHYRAVASNSLGLVRGNEVRFWAPKVTLMGERFLTNECHAGLTEDMDRFLVGSAYAFMDAGSTHNLALRADGALVGWGANSLGQINVPSSATQVNAVAAGGSHSLALCNDGRVVGWGGDHYGQATIPDAATNIIAIAAGSSHSLALTATGTLLSWGDGSNGQTNTPARATNVVAITAGDYHNLALLADGTAVGWGDNLFAQATVPAMATNIAALAAGGLHSLALRADGTVVAWGHNPGGQATGVPNPVYPHLSTGMVQVAGRTLSNAVAVAAGGYHNLALRADGTVVAWGQNDSGQTTVPAAATNIVAVAAGESHSLALRADGVIIGWGRNQRGQAAAPPPTTYGVMMAAGYSRGLALTASGMLIEWGEPHGNNANTIHAIPVEATNVTAFSVGGSHSLVLRADRMVVGWGYNGYQQVTPPAAATNVVAIAAGAYHSLAARADGRVVGWGANTAGQINVPENATNIVGVAAGYYHSLGLRGDGTVVAWGLGTMGQTNIPATATEVTAIAAGTFHGLALRNDGTVVGWGHNSAGQTTIPPDAHNVVAIAAGGDHSLALRDDGTVVAWGSNEHGQTSVPPGATNVVAIAAGSSHSLALRRDGIIVAWGDNTQNLSVVPALLDFPRCDITTSGTVNPDAAGWYDIVKTATTSAGALGTATRSLSVVDTIPPLLTLMGSDYIVIRRGTAFTDPGAVASDSCAGDLTGSIQIVGNVPANSLGPWTVTYSVADPSGNSAVTERTVLVADQPTLSTLSATSIGTQPLTGTPRAQFTATVNPNGLPTSARLEYGQTTAYPGGNSWPNLGNGFSGQNIAVATFGLLPGITYHWRVSASNELGVTTSSDQRFTAPLVFPAGDLDGDGVVSQSELDQILANYWPTSPWLQMTNVIGLGESQITFALTNSTAGTFSVEMSTNLLDWEYLGPATPRYEFADTNAPAHPARYYRLRWP